MERSAATGILAANTILAARGYVTEPVWSVPTRGMLAGRRRPRLARRDPRTNSATGGPYQSQGGDRLTAEGTKKPTAEADHGRT
jgi:hypothetical protein